MQVVKELTKATKMIFYASDELQKKVTKAYVRAGEKRIERNPYNQLMTCKVNIVMGNLRQKQAELVYIMRRQVNQSIRFVENSR